MSEPSTARQFVHKPCPGRLERLYNQLIVPAGDTGILKGQLAKLAGVKDADGLLASLEFAGFLVSEDDAGRIYPFSGG